MAATTFTRQVKKPDSKAMSGFQKSKVASAYLIATKNKRSDCSLYDLN